MLPMLPMHLASAQKVMRNAACHNSHVKAKKRRIKPGQHFPSCQVCSFRVTVFCLFSACTADRSAFLHTCVFQTNLKLMENESVHGAGSREHAIRIIPGAAAVSMAKANIIYIYKWYSMLVLCTIMLLQSPLPL